MRKLKYPTQNFQAVPEALPAAAGIKLSELIGALSHALDITEGQPEGQPEGHCIRCCKIGMHIGREAGLAERFRNVLTILRDGSEIAQELIATRCQRGADIAGRFRYRARSR